MQGVGVAATLRIVLAKVDQAEAKCIPSSHPPLPLPPSFHRIPPVLLSTQASLEQLLPLLQAQDHDPAFRDIVLSVVGRAAKDKTHGEVHGVFFSPVGDGVLFLYLYQNKE